ncbi:MAG: plasmid pRiA4b family protein [Acidobacteria bacterium]|nr:plasmid pRiA4b family protein [Acidobacteriota bacterium]
MTSIRNRYCQHLGIPVPRIEDVAGRPELTLFQLVVMVLLERGGPMTVDEIAARLDRAALPARLARPDFVGAVKKAWHGQSPLVRDGDERLALDLLSSEFRHITFVAGLRPSLVPRPGPGEFRLPTDDEPLSQAEVTAAFSGRSLAVYSSIRKAAAVLEAWGSPQTLDDIDARLRRLTGYGGRIDATTVRAWRTDLVAADPDGSLRLNATSSSVGAFRRDIRRTAAPRLRAFAESRDFTVRMLERERQRVEEERDLMAHARQTRRALLHIVPPGQPARAAAVIDLHSRDLQLFAGDNLPTLAAKLEAFDFLAGVDLRISLRALGLDPERWLLAELRPVQRTFRPAERSPVPVTLPAAVQATTGVSRVPADATIWGRLLDPTRLHDVAGRLTTEARALCVLYEYGALHGGVRVRTRPGDRLLPVEWGLRGDPDMYSVLDAAMRACVPVDLVIGAPPDSADPWRHVVRADIADCVGQHIVIRTPGDVQSLSTDDVHAARVTDPAAVASVRPRHTYSQHQGVCQLTVTLDGIEPPIWRRLVVPAWFTLEKLHGVLQTALGWTNSHLHMFQFGDERVGMPYELGDLGETYTRSGRIVRLGDLVARGHRRLVYEYDFGDGWTHTIEIDEVRDEEGPRLACLDGARACPPEDCGGVDGYHHLLEILFDPTHQEFEDSRHWVGPAFEPERFDLRRVNQQLEGQWA